MQRYGKFLVYSKVVEQGAEQHVTYAYQYVCVCVCISKGLLLRKATGIEDVVGR